jgi:hypothetical protein
VNADTWATVADLATALGTLVLAVATFSAVRSGNRTARAAEQSLLTSLRPLLMPSKLSDEPLKVNFGDSKWVLVPGGTGVAQIGGGDGTLGPADGVVYFTISLRNVGNGMAVLHGWRLSYERATVAQPMPPLDEFTLQTRDLYIPVNDTGFWQGAIRDLADPRYDMARKVIESRSEWYMDLLYGDYDGGQRTITRFRCQYRQIHVSSGSGGSGAGGSSGASGSGASGSGAGGKQQEASTWLATVARHWALDQPDPRSADRAAYQ